VIRAVAAPTAQPPSDHPSIQEHIAAQSARSVPERPDAPQSCPARRALTLPHPQRYAAVRHATVPNLVARGRG
jgi:hypothetical protein